MNRGGISHNLFYIIFKQAIHTNYGRLVLYSKFKYLQFLKQNKVIVSIINQKT